jgi:arylsulfatase A-like enzyme
MITELDDGIGRVLAALKAEGMHDNTVIAFNTGAQL